ncbi:uncharacterized protein [Lepisosteus oculatus]|uniref:uncharacterized protein n=1 Tax=Lepisosteus oculatus TaxID=7918 RepID=UPI00371F30AF
MAGPGWVWILMALGATPVEGELIVDRGGVSLAHGESSRFSSSLWLKPAFCLFEDWLGQAEDKAAADRETAFVQVEVMREGEEDVIYKCSSVYPIPQCDPLFSEPDSVRDAPYRLGPELSCLNDTCGTGVLPGQGYRVRYAVYSEGDLIVATNWSRPLRTRDKEQLIEWISLDFAHSGGMVVITVLLSLAMLTLVIVLPLSVMKAG